MNTIDTKLLLNGLKDIVRLSHDAFGETESKQGQIMLDNIKDLAHYLEDHIKWIENLNYIENRLLGNGDKK